MTNPYLTNAKYLYEKSIHTVYYEHSIHLAILLDGLNSLRKSSELFDITLVVGSTYFKAHKVVLAACSDYFRAMFTDNMREAKQDVIYLNSITARGFQQVLDYAYTTHLSLNTHNIQDILEAASYVQIIPMVQTCSSYLQTQIDIENCVDIATIAETYSLKNLKMCAYKFMSANLLEFSSSPEFYRLMPHQLETLLKYEYPVNCSEAEVLRIVLAWFLHVDDSKKRFENAARIIHRVHFEEVAKDKLISTVNKVFGDRKYEWQLYSIIATEIQEQAIEKSMGAKAVMNLLNSRGMGMVVLKIGGFGVDGITNDITYRFHNKRKWKHLTTIPHMEQCNFSTVVFQNDLFVIGGCFNQCLQENIHSYGYRYNPSYDKWDNIANMKTERCRFSLSVVRDRLYAVGGASEGDEGGTSACERYDPEADLWTAIAPLPTTLTQHASAGYDFKCSRLYVCGGIDRERVQGTMYYYDILLEKWKETTPMFKPRADHVLLRIGDCLYACGGWTEGNETAARALVETIDVYDVKEESWKVLTKIPTPRYHAGICNVDTKIYFVGGFHSDTMFEKDTAAIECYDIVADKWTVEAKYPQDIWEHSCASLFIPKCRDDVEVVQEFEILGDSCS